MLKRLWLVLSTLWALLFLAGGIAKPQGIEGSDVWLVSMPFIVGIVAYRLGRFVLTGRWTAQPSEAASSALRRHPRV